MNELQTLMLTIQKTISEMDRLSGQLPVCQSLDQLAGMLEDTNFSPDEPPQFQMASRDARLLAQYLRMAYLDVYKRQSESCGRRGFLLRISVQFCVSREQRRFIFISR